MIDCHFHIWDIKKTYYTWLNKDLGVLYKNYSLKDYEKTIQNTTIKKSIIVQAADHLDESKNLLKLATLSDNIAGVIAWVDFLSKDVLAQIDSLNTNKKLLGLRPMLQDIKDEAWIMNEKFEKIFKKLIKENLVFEALIKENHLKYIIKIAQKYPKLKIVINHCAKPNIKDHHNKEDFTKWASLIKEAAKEQNIFCKISGLVTQCENEYDYKTLEAYVIHVKENFGAKRLLWGSDWPVLHLKCSYDTWLHISNKLFKNFTLKEKESLLETNAYQIYKINTLS